MQAYSLNQTRAQIGEIIGPKWLLFRVFTQFVFTRENDFQTSESFVSGHFYCIHTICSEALDLHLGRVGIMRRVVFGDDELY